MGLFSSKYVTTVGTTVSRVVQNTDIVSSVKVGLMASLFGADSTQLVENVLESMTASLGVRAERLHSYAKTSYTYGLPAAKITNSFSGKEVVLGIIRAEIDPGVTLDYYHIGALNTLHVGWMKLASELGYVSDTNQLAVLSTAKGTPVYLKDMVMVLQDVTFAERDNGSLNQWGIAANAGVTPNRPSAHLYLSQTKVATPFRIDATALGDSVEVTYVWEQPTLVVVNGVTVTRKILTEASVLLPISGYELDKDYVQVKYINGLTSGHWLYELDSGVHPEIDSVFNAPASTVGEFFPVTYFRHQFISMGADKTTPAYKTSKTMLKRVGIDYDTVIDAVHANPDIDKIDQAMLVFGVSPNTTEAVGKQYLFDFFSKLYLSSGGIGVGWDIGNVPVSALEDYGQTYSFESSLLTKLLALSDAPRIRMSIGDSRLNTALTCQSIFKKKKSGVVAPVGQYASAFKTESIVYAHTTYVDDVLTPGTYASPLDVFVYQHQITASVYEEVRVYDLKLTYNMWGGHYTIGDDLDAILLVPIDHTVTKSYSLLNRERLYTVAMHYVFNSRVVTKVKWYQQEWFSDLIMIVGLVLTVVSLGADGGFFTKLSAVMVFALSAVDVVMYIIMSLLPALLTTVVMKLFVKVAGPELAFIVAMVAAVYGSYTAIKAGSIQGAPWAQELLSLSSNLSSSVNASIQDAMQRLNKEANAFNLFATEQQGLLESANKLLETTSLLSPHVIFGESPDEFYNRTIHSGNVGIVGIECISTYVERSLALPKFNETIEGKYYG